jgi:Tfp pilus assembly protein PilN
MIRINLGKDELLQAGGKAQRYLDAKLPTAVKAQLAKMGGDAGTIVMLGSALAFATLFPLFANQYEAAVIAQHQAEVKELNAKVDILKQQINQLQPFQREMESYGQQKKVVTERLQVVRDLIEQRTAPVNILDTVGQSLPQRTWISSLEFSSADGGTINLTGSSYSNEEVSDFVDKLSESVYLNEVSLEDLGTSKSEDKIEVRTFQVAARSKTKLSGPSSEVRAISSIPPAATPPGSATAPKPAPGHPPGSP